MECTTIPSVLLIACAIVWCMSAGEALKYNPPLDVHSFRFTHQVYNASISENAVPKTYVEPEIRMGIYLSDPSVDIRYKITQGDENSMFKPDEVIQGNFCFLRLRLKSNTFVNINREIQDLYVFVIRGIARYKNGASFYAQTTVRLRVLDVNDLSPLFTPTSYTVEVAEDTAVHTNIAQVTATDADIGMNGEVYYSLEEVKENFAIHPTSGSVSLTRPLVYIEENYYKLTVLAQDRGPTLGRKKRVAKASLEVRVLEVNAHAPTIDLQELPAVVEHGNIGTIYAILYVHDKDYGDNGRVTDVTILGGNVNGYFTLVPGKASTEYNIAVAKTLDREVNPAGFNLTIQASDGGQPSKTTHKTVYVKLADTNDQVPRFDKPIYDASIEECVPVDTPVLFVKAKDRDLRKNAEVIYSISQGNTYAWFSINAFSGLISVASALDAETVAFVNLTISAQDQGNRGSRKTAYAQVTVNLVDCNDNSPKFNSTDEDVSVMENQPAGTEIYQVRAYDLDQGDNGYLSYSLVDEPDFPFTIDHFTGKITTKEVLDYETMKRIYNVRIRASDWGTPFRRESDTVLKIRLRDQNDNKPEFEKVDCMGYLSRRAPVGTELTTISAIDLDQGNIITYHLVEDYDCYEINPSTGSLRTKCDLSEFRDNKLSLEVLARDGINTATPTTVNITFVDNRNIGLDKNNANFNCRYTDVIDRLSRLMTNARDNNLDEAVEVAPSTFVFNNNAPRFSDESSIEFVVQENVPVGHTIWKYEVEDKDQSYNGRIMFVIKSGNMDGIFKIDTYTGELTVMAPLDRETRSKYIINITAMDMGQPPRIDSLLVEITVADYNDHAPQFRKNHYTISVSEVVMVNATVLQVIADDADEAENARIKYSILTDLADFRINPDTGMIQVNRELDRERIIHYELVVQARDCALEHALTSTVTVGIAVTDINDNPPRFHLDEYTVRIREDLPVGTVVLTISASDPDLSGGGVVRYNLQDGMDNKFKIDRQTGTIRIVEPLDYEQKQVYNITARARDRGQVSLISKCRIVVEIIDVNENLYSPKFKDFVVVARVQENSRRNTHVVQLKATDMDQYNSMATPKDYEIGYSIRDGSGMGYFTIDNQGWITTNKLLDRESKPLYWLTVFAQDKAAVPRSSWVSVLVEVADVNDNIPQTFAPVYYPSVIENSPSETSVLQLQATDLDEEPNNNITYEIVSGNPHSFFQISPYSGLISTTNRKLDREKQEEHILEVKVLDNGSPPLSSTTRVVVRILDENDEAPVFTERLYSVLVPARPEGDVNQHLYRVVASDPDADMNADIDYSIDGKANGRFHIDPKSGMISSDKAFEEKEQYDITVLATDNGRPQKESSSRVLLKVVDAPVRSVNPPVFLETHRTVTVLENFDVGQMVELLQASDPDGDRVWYSITEGNVDDMFSIDPVAGNIILCRGLDWETHRQYNLTVQASDGFLTAKCQVIVNVKDIEDNRPEFTQSIYHVSVNENVEEGSRILTVTATDDDHDKRLFYTIHAATDQQSLGKFQINSETDARGYWTGVITTREPLNREAMSQHELTVMVRDQGTPSKRGLARVSITVDDHNDHAPDFLAKLFEGKVLETATPGTSVLQVLATDRDAGLNAQITYSIVSGNIGNTFTIDGTLGIIALAKPVSKHGQDTFNLQVKATDGGHEPLSSVVPVTINVTMSNNAPPRFELSEYTSEIQENRPEGVVILPVKAVSQSSVVYEIKDDDRDLFKISPNGGIVTSNVVFDFEEASFYNLTVQATNMVGVSTETMVRVHIVDENDNAPEFSQEEYVGSISEASPPGSNILDPEKQPLVVKATDRDKDRNALLVYTIEDSTALDIFQIDANTGAISAKSTLDHEVAATYSFTVQVRDKGTPRRTAEVAAIVKIHVLDVNDSPPLFTKEEYEADLLFPTYKEVAIVTVSATDADWEVNSTLKYRLDSGNEDGHFAIDSLTGQVTVVDPGSMRDFYLLKVKVTDGVFENDATIQINVKMSVNSGLQIQENYYAEIMENVTGVQNVAVVQARGHELNENLVFKILNTNNMFSIGQTSGSVKTVGTPFDREYRSNYTLVIEVRDQREPVRIAHGLLHVQIQDSNDNTPIFVNRPYYAAASIDAEIGEAIKQVTALDHDIGDNGRVVYSLISEGGDSNFQIDRKTGMISVKRSLSRETENQLITLNVVATDKGTPPQSTVVKVPIRIMNHATPVFSQQFFNVSIPENIPMHSAILNAEANSPHAKKLIYSIASGNIYGEFAVDFNTDMEVLGPCSVTVVDKLDYENHRSYELSIRATDTSTGSDADAIVHINVIDVNDHAPKFDRHHYVSTVSEAIPIGTVILTVTATDRDSPPNAGIHYHIEPNFLDAAFFHIDSDKGVVLSKQRLDHEEKAQLSFKVVATDTGVPAMSSSVLVKVTVTDLNDNAPQFDQLTYKVTITDLLKRAEFVTIVTASDKDSLDAGRLAYSIVGGNEKRTFVIGETSGIVSLSSLRIPELDSNYQLNISVTDGVYTAFARVLITVQNSNTHAPKFAHQVYDVDVAENLPPGLIAQVTATDKDLGAYGEVEYEIESEDAQEYFSIDVKTGDVKSTVPLDRERQALYQVPVVAKDGGGRAGFTMLRVNVADLGDHKPYFHMAQYQANVNETAQPGAIVLEVSAEDSDLGSNGDLTYTLYNGNTAEASDYFHIDPNTGVITLRRELTGREDTSFQFFVRATDKSTSPKEADVPVEIYVMGRENHPPKFPQDSYTYFYEEDQPVGSHVAVVAAISNETLSHSIIDGSLPKTNKPQVFGISDDGSITLLATLDRESIETFELTIKAETQTSPSLVAYCHVTIKVLDVNDNAPVFELNPYGVNIAENADIGSQVVHVVSRDLDSGANGDISYDFAPGFSDISNTFAIDSETGWITTLVTLDRENVDYYEFDVIASDRGSPKKQTDVTKVKVRVTDHNDNPPVFLKTRYDGAMNEDAIEGAVVLTVTTMDQDVGSNAQVLYYITEGDPLSQFGIKQTGDIFVNKPLDREETLEYTLTVVATDGAFVSTVPIHVNILDANDNAPVCQEAPSVVDLSENAATGTIVTTVTATDADEPNTRNSRILFTLESGNEGEVFMMHETSGVISTRKLLDREAVPEFILIVHAQDGGGLSCVIEVQVSLTDVNDNAPVFGSALYIESVPEDAEINTLLTRVSAVDADLGINRQVRYAMQDSENGGHFEIDPMSGIVSLKKQLDREEQDKYNITIFAHDQGTPKMTSRSHLVVHLLDINDNKPEFELSTYFETVDESREVGASVVQVYATSRDAGVNAEISYSIMAGNELAKFQIDSKTGVISIVQAVDYESSREFFLTIQATDRGTPPLSNTAVLKLNVTDFNDNSPLFAQEKYMVELKEDAPQGYKVIQVHAADLDSPANAAITYYIVNGDPEHRFSIHPQHGMVQVEERLDRETESSYALEIHAVDSGSPQLTGKTVLHIELMDVNDSPPKCSQNNYTALIQENEELGFTVLALEVTDADLPPNGAPFLFDIVDGNPEHHFRIDRNGVITTAARFDRVVKDTYRLTVRVFDNGSPALNTDVKVKVTLIEESAFPPKVSPLSITVTVDGDVFRGGIIGRVDAVDSDPFDVLRYDVVSSNAHLFAVDSATGNVRAVQEIDAGNYRINISVSDGKFVVYADVELNIESIVEEMAENAVVVRFKKVTPLEFVTSYKAKMIQTLSHELAARNSNTNIVKVHILSMQPSSDKVVKPSRPKRQASRDSEDLDVLLAVRKFTNTSQNYYGGSSLRKKIQGSRETLEDSVGLQILTVFNNVCSKDACVEGTCETEILFDPDSPVVLGTPGNSFVTSPYQMSYVCRCNRGYVGPLCDEEICSTNHCPAPRLCKASDDGMDYICECPEGLSGPDCQQRPDPPCSGSSCNRQPMTFSGDSYIAWHVTVPMERHLNLVLTLKTVQENARLMHSIGQLDYSILEIVHGMVQYRYNLGSGEGLARVSAVLVNDGYWHTVFVERIARNAHVVVDNKFMADGTAPPSNELLNLNSNIMYFGGEVNMKKGYPDVKRGYVGCMKGIQIDSVDLPHAGSNSVGFLQKMFDMEYHCRGTYIPGVCSSSPCLNGGSCIPVGKELFVCQCRTRFVGNWCETDTNPCASSPCLNAGNCENRKNDFRCTCTENMTGKRCEKLIYCNPNPCQHNGKCEEGDNGPVCNCPGFQGTYCEHDINECLPDVNPCKHGAACINSHGSYKCNCSDPTMGTHCEKSSGSRIESSAIGIEKKEIMWIAIALVLMVVFVLIIILVIRCRTSRKKREQDRACNEHDGASDPFLSNDEITREKQRNRMNSHQLAVSNHHPSQQAQAQAPPPNIPPPVAAAAAAHPPRIPARPTSYTPSNAESMNTLNNCNYDAANNYGSAGDDLENIGTLSAPIEIPAFLTNVDAEKNPPPPPRKIHNALSNDPNYAQNYPDNVKQRHNKFNIPPEDSPLAPSSSAISLPESEDLSGYHWDTSDWQPAQPHRNPAMYQAPSGPQAADEEIIHSEDDYALTDFPGDEEEEGNESEYVMDSEYVENEYGEEDEDDGFLTDFPADQPSYQELLGADLLHHYLPAFHPEHDSQEHMATATEMMELNGNLAAAQNAIAAEAAAGRGAGAAVAAAAAAPEDPDKDVVYYGFTKPTTTGSNRRRRKNRQSMISNDNRYSGDFGLDYDGANAITDDMSISVGGYTSTNASMSDISGVCDIEDSEANLSDYDSHDELTAALQKRTDGTTHTVV